VWLAEPREEDETGHALSSAADGGWRGGEKKEE
jgi:hypothetical protein